MAKQGLIGGENENQEGDISNGNVKPINVGNKGDDADVKINLRPPNHEERAKSEQKRRTTESQLFEDLRGLLPQLSPQAYKSTVVDVAINTIKGLEQTLHDLEEQKLKRVHCTSTNNTGTMATLVPSENLVANNEAVASGNNSDENLNIFKTWISPNVTLSVCDTDAIISICALKKPELFTKVCFILEILNLEIMSAQVSADEAKTMYIIRVRGTVDPELENGVPHEERFKRATTQIIQAVM